MTPRKRKMTPEMQADLARLKKLVQGIPKDRLSLVLERSKRVNFTVTPQEHEDIRRTAESFGLTMTDYILRLHALVSERLREETRRK